MMENESNKIASNTVSQIIGRMIVLAFSLISIKLVTNYLGLEGTGYYSTVVTYFSFVIVIADLGLFSVVVREISKDPSQKKRLLANVFTLRAVTAVVATLVAILMSRFSNYPAEIKTGIMIASLFPIFNLLGSVYDMIFQYQLKMQRVVFAEVVSKVVVVTGIYLSIIFNLGYYAIIATVSLNALLMFIIKALISEKQIPLYFRYDRNLIADVVKMALPLGIVFIVNNLYFKIDTLMLFFMKGPAAVGVYSVVYRVLETSLFAGSFLATSLKPLLSVSIDQDRPKAENAISQAIIFLIFMALAIAVASITFAREIILLLSNQDFLSGYKALILLGTAPIFIYVSAIFGEILVAKDMRRKMLLISLFILAFNVLLNLILIPRFSFNGAAISTIISEIVLLSMSYLAIRKSVNIHFDFTKIMKLILLAGLSMTIGFVLKQTGLNFVFNILIITALYFFLSYHFEAIPKNVFRRYLISIKTRWVK